MAPKILVVLTNADTNTINGSKTGWYLVCFTPNLHDSFLSTPC
jgi:hypothetical protein